MANKYVYHGAAFNGDGTTPNPAVSDGAPGAWNDLYAVSKGNVVYGSIDSEDIIYIRTKDASDNDYTINVTDTYYYFGNPLSSSDQWNMWVFDDGQVWPGVKGTVTFDFLYIFYIRAYNSVVGNNRVVFRRQYNSNTYNIATVYRSYTSGIMVDMSSNLSVFGTRIYAYDALMSGWKLVNLNKSNVGLIVPVYNGWQVFFGLDIECINDVGNCLFYPYSPGSTMMVIGGSYSGPTSAMQYLSAPRSGSCFIDGYYINANLPVGTPAGSAGNYVYHNHDFTHEISTSIFDITSANDGNFPVLNGVLPTNPETRTSLRLLNKSSTLNMPSQILFSLPFDSLPATRTFRVEMLIPNDIIPSSDSVWLDIIYMDESEQIQHATSFDVEGGNIPVSSANWSATTYGATSYNKYYIELTTPNNIKKDSMVFGLLNIAIADTDYWFIDPVLSQY